MKKTCLNCGNYFTRKNKKFCSRKCIDEYNKYMGHKKEKKEKPRKYKYKKSKKLFDIEFNGDIWHIHRGKDGRERAYSKGRCISYPKFLLMTKGVFVDDGYDVHHKDGNYEHNNIENFSIMNHIEHEKYHNKKKKIQDKIMICPECGKKFIWTVKKQKNFNSNIRRQKCRNKSGIVSSNPFCSKSCSGKYSQRIQMSLKKNE